MRFHRVIHCRQSNNLTTLLFVCAFLGLGFFVTGITGQSNRSFEIGIDNNNKNNDLIQINILLLLPINDTYKFSMSKVLASLNLAINDLKQTDYGSRFRIDLISDTCDCTGIKAPVNAMENIFGKRNHTKQFQAVFGPMCD